PYDLQSLPKGASLRPLLDAGGAAVGTMATLPPGETEAPQDVEPEYRVLAESIPQIVFTASADGSFEFVNQKLIEYTGLAASALRGYDWQNAIHPDDVDAFAEAYFRCMETGETFERECRIRRRDGE